MIVLGAKKREKTEAEPKAEKPVKAEKQAKTKKTT